MQVCLHEWGTLPESAGEWREIHKTFFQHMPSESRLVRSFHALFVVLFFIEPRHISEKSCFFSWERGAGARSIFRHYKSPKTAHASIAVTNVKQSQHRTNDFREFL